MCWHILKITSFSFKYIIWWEVQYVINHESEFGNFCFCDTRSFCLFGNLCQGDPEQTNERVTQLFIRIQSRRLCNKGRRRRRKRCWWISSSSARGENRKKNIGRGWAFLSIYTRAKGCWRDIPPSEHSWPYKAKNRTLDDYSRRRDCRLIDALSMTLRVHGLLGVTHNLYSYIHRKAFIC